MSLEQMHVLTGGSGAVKAEFTGANMVMFRSGLFSADACPKPCMQTFAQQWETHCPPWRLAS